MRVWVYPEKKYHELGEERWICEWYTLRESWKAAFEGDSPEPEDLICHVKAFKTKAGAIKDAHVHLARNDDFYGNPVVRRQIVDWYVEEDRIGQWSDVGDAIYVE